MAFHHRQLKILRNFLEVKPALAGHAVFTVNHKTAGSAKTQECAHEGIEKPLPERLD
jgi:hypothetical protein